jgi:flagellar protein FlaI
MKKFEKLEEYYIESEKIGAKIEILREENEISLKYNLIIPVIEKATAALLDDVRSELVKEVNLTVSEILDIRNAGELKKKFYEKIYEIVKKKMPNEPESKLVILSGMLLNKSFGLGDIEFLINDALLEEIVINGSNKPVWVFHKQHGWLKTNLIFESESTIFNYAASIGRKIGRQINNLDPLLDAHLTTGVAAKFWLLISLMFKVLNFSWKGDCLIFFAISSSIFSSIFSSTLDGFVILIVKSFGDDSFFSSGFKTSLSTM